MIEKIQTNQVLLFRPQYLIVLTVSRQKNNPGLSTAARAIKDRGVEVFSIGLGPNVDEEELQDIASQPENVYQVSASLWPSFGPNLWSSLRSSTWWQCEFSYFLPSLPSLPSLPFPSFPSLPFLSFFPFPSFPSFLPLFLPFLPVHGKACSPRKPLRLFSVLWVRTLDTD